jgi:hypothetical protein
MTTRGFLQDMGILGRVNASEMHIEYDNLLIQGNFVTTSLTTKAIFDYFLVKASLN